MPTAEKTCTKDEFRELIREEVRRAGPRLVREPDDAGSRNEEYGSREFASGRRFPAFIRDRNCDARGLKKDEFSFVRYIEGILAHGKFEGLEREVVEASQKRTITWSSGAGGGFWVGTEFLPNEFIEDLYAEMVVAQSGAMVIPCTGSPVNIPGGGGATAHWATEGQAIPPSDPNPRNLQLTPHWCVALVQLGQFTARTSAGAAEAIIRRDIARQVGIAVDRAALEGQGASGTPLGMLGTPYINTVSCGSTNGGPFLPPKWFEMLYELERDNVKEDGLAWFMNHRTWNYVRQFVMETATYKYLINPNPSAREPRSILGIPVYRSTSISTTNTKGNGTALANIFLADAKDIFLANWGTLEIAATDVGGTGWTHNNIEIKATYTVDVGIRHPESVCLINDSTS